MILTSSEIPDNGIIYHILWYFKFKAQFTLGEGEKDILKTIGQIIVK